MLKIENLSVDYGNISALRGVSLEVKENQIVSLIGANGAGKTTTLMAVSGLAAKSGGSVSFAGEDITRERASRIVQRGICHVPEGRHIFPRMTVEENLVAGSFGDRTISRVKVREKVEEMYDLFPRLKERKSQLGGTLSGGEQQMLAIARGLMFDPRLVMFDEPSMGLAPIVVEEIFGLILKIKEMGKTILLIEQNASMALQIADWGYVLETGEITLQGAGRDLLADENVKKAYLGI
ncbi:ABC transporter ATP-binding protein [Enterocloster asparagiformis]|uniref:ABC transporter ATP-binding protein n=1 Tax=Enterocloster asparagiformis TaxID=333367 RepID=UPI00046669B6|nr:ABC transporter ATP-binding protein [Enterocloster asparagiformis]